MDSLLRSSIVVLGSFLSYAAAVAYYEVRSWNIYRTALALDALAQSSSEPSPRDVPHRRATRVRSVWLITTTTPVPPVCTRSRFDWIR